MSRYTFKQHLLTSLCCSVAFAFILACTGKAVLRTPILGTKAATISSTWALGTFRHLIPASDNAPVLASFFQSSGTASDVPESFQFTCNFDRGFLASLQPGQIVAVAGFLNEYPTNVCNLAFSAPQPPQVFWTNHSPAGTANYDVQGVFHAGTIQSLVATALTSSSPEVRCADLTDTAPVGDGDVVLAYLDPHANTVTLYDNTSSLGISCQLSGVPASDTYLLLSVRFVKV